MRNHEFHVRCGAKADTATVSFDAAKAGKLPRGFQDYEQIGSFEKSGVRGARGNAMYRRERIERHRDGWRGTQRGSGIYAHDREGISKISRGGGGGDGIRVIARKDDRARRFVVTAGPTCALNRALVQAARLRTDPCVRPTPKGARRAERRLLNELTLTRHAATAYRAAACSVVHPRKADTATVSFDARESGKIIPRFSRLRANRLV